MRRSLSSLQPSGKRGNFSTTIVQTVVIRQQRTLKTRWVREKSPETLAKCGQSSYLGG